MTLPRTAVAASALMLALMAGPALAQSAHAGHAGHGAPAAAPLKTKLDPGGLYEIVFNTADNTVLVAAVGPRGENRARIHRLNGADLTPAGEPIDVAANPLYGLGFNSRTQTLYGTATRSGSVDAVDVRTGRVIGHIADAGNESAHVREAIVDEAANKVYVSVVGGEPGDASRPNQIWVIDGATNTLERKIDVQVGGLTGVALDAANNRLFVTGMGSHDVGVVDLATGATVSRWAVGSERPTNVAFDARGGRLFVASQGGGDLTVMNAADGAVIRKVPTGEGALSVAYSAGNDRIYVANRVAGTVTVVSGADYSVLTNVETGTFPQTIAVDPASNRVYVTNKARGLPRNAPAGTPVPEDANGDTVVVIQP